MTAGDSHIDFACPHCGQTGVIVWNGVRQDRALVHLSPGFHVEEGRLPRAKHVIVCDTCDEIDPPRIAAAVSTP